MPVLLRGRLLLRLRGQAPAAGLLLGAAVLLGAVSLIPLAFEDSYQHWLMAANLARNGRLVDPLFGMEDTWLPGYQLLAAVVLKVFGWQQIGLLRALGVGIGLATLALVNQLAGGGRRGALAMILLGLNPIFLLTTTSVVAEPLLVLLLLGATSAALARRYPLAALLAVAACLTGTKAWLWLLAVAVAYPLVSGDRARLRPALAWAVPALGVALLLQLGLGSATHSVARAAEEVTAAGARGSLPTSPLARGAEFVGTFALASLPLVVLAPVGLVAEWRRGVVARVRLLHLPAVLYFAAVAGLVFAGAYSGSHRYLYPVLPALAVLAAAALEKRAAPAAIGAVGAAGLLAIAFLPVLQGLGSLDGGLQAAGIGAGRYPGALLTDSPVAAFFSGRPPEQVLGSQDLPADPTRAVAWLRVHGVGPLVLEDVSYYRAEMALPGLAKGVAEPPFVALVEGDPTAIPGAKSVAAYWLPPGPFTGSAGGAVLSLDPLRQPRQGKTAGLEKGLVLEGSTGALAGEGMGFGVPLVRYPQGDYFSGSAATVDVSTPGHTAWVKSFQLDRLGADQDRSFAAVPSRGRVDVTYRVEPGQIDIQVVAVDLEPGFQQVVILNEESSRFDDFADVSQTLLGDRIGSWTPVAGGWGRLRSAALGLEWSLDRPAGAAGMYAAHELRAPDIDFSGIEYVFGPDFTAASYAVAVGQAR